MAAGLRALQPLAFGAWGALIAAAVVLAGCATAQPPAIESMAAQLRPAHYVLLGEVHDNPEHHRRRAQLLRALLADGRPTPAVFEQMDRSRDAAIAAALRDAEAVADAGRLDRAGWRWPLHRPLVQAALDAGAVIAGGGFDRDFARRLVFEGPGVAPDLDAAVRAVPWTAEQERTLHEAIVTGHCGMLPPDSVAPMVRVQRSRDAALAQAMLKAPEPRVVLIAGNGHVRSDVGVPHYLRAAGVPPADIVAIGFVEAGDDTSAALFNLEQVTAAAPRPDPCAAFKAPPPAR